MKATYTSVWDDELEVTTSCEVNMSTGEVSDIETSDTVPDGICTREYVTVGDREYDVTDGHIARQVSYESVIAQLSMYSEPVRKRALENITPLNWNRWYPRVGKPEEEFVKYLEMAEKSRAAMLNCTPRNNDNDCAWRMLKDKINEENF